MQGLPALKKITPGEKSSVKIPSGGNSMPTTKQNSVAQSSGGMASAGGKGRPNSEIMRNPDGTFAQKGTGQVLLRDTNLERQVAAGNVGNNNPSALNGYGKRLWNGVTGGSSQRKSIEQSRAQTGMKALTIPEFLSQAAQAERLNAGVGDNEKAMLSSVQEKSPSDAYSQMRATRSSASQQLKQATAKERIAQRNAETAEQALVQHYNASNTNIGSNSPDVALSYLPDNDQYVRNYRNRVASYAEAKKATQQASSRYDAALAAENKTREKLYQQKIASQDDAAEIAARYGYKKEKAMPDKDHIVLFEDSAVPGKPDKKRTIQITFDDDYNGIGTSSSTLQPRAQLAVGSGTSESVAAVDAKQLGGLKPTPSLKPVAPPKTPSMTASSMNGSKPADITKPINVSNPLNLSNGGSVRKNSDIKRLPDGTFAPKGQGEVLTKKDDAMVGQQNSAPVQQASNAMGEESGLIEHNESGVLEDVPAPESTPQNKPAYESVLAASTSRAKKFASGMSLKIALAGAEEELQYAETPKEKAEAQELIDGIKRLRTEKNIDSLRKKSQDTETNKAEDVLATINKNIGIYQKRIDGFKAAEKKLAGDAKKVAVANQQFYEHAISELKSVADGLNAQATPAASTSEPSAEPASEAQPVQANEPNTEIPADSTASEPSPSSTESEEQRPQQKDLYVSPEDYRSAKRNALYTEEEIQWQKDRIKEGFTPLEGWDKFSDESEQEAAVWLENAKQELQKKWEDGGSEGAQPTYKNANARARKLLEAAALKATAKGDKDAANRFYSAQAVLDVMNDWTDTNTAIRHAQDDERPNQRRRPLIAQIAKLEKNMRGYEGDANRNDASGNDALGDVYRHSIDACSSLIGKLRRASDAVGYSANLAADDLERKFRADTEQRRKERAEAEKNMTQEQKDAIKEANRQKNKQRKIDSIRKKIDENLAAEAKELEQSKQVYATVNADIDKIGDAGFHFPDKADGMNDWSSRTNAIALNTLAAKNGISGEAAMELRGKAEEAWRQSKKFPRGSSQQANYETLSSMYEEAANIAATSSEGYAAKRAQYEQEIKEITQRQASRAMTSQEINAATGSKFKADFDKALPEDPAAKKSLMDVYGDGSSNIVEVEHVLEQAAKKLREEYDNSSGTRRNEINETGRTVMAAYNAAKAIREEAGAPAWKDWLKMGGKPSKDPSKGYNVSVNTDDAPPVDDPATAQERESIKAQVLSSNGGDGAAAIDDIDRKIRSMRSNITRDHIGGNKEFGIPPSKGYLAAKAELDKYILVREAIKSELSKEQEGGDTENAAAPTPAAPAPEPQPAPAPTPAAPAPTPATAAPNSGLNPVRSDAEGLVNSYGGDINATVTWAEENLSDLENKMDNETDSKKLEKLTRDWQMMSSINSELRKMRREQGGR